MKFQILSTLSLLCASAIAYPAPAVSDTPLSNQIQLYAVGDEIGRLGLSSIHEGAAVNYFELGTGAEALSFDEDEGRIYQTQSSANNIPINLSLSIFEVDGYTGFPFLQLSAAVADVKWSTYEDNGIVYLQSNSTNAYFAGKNANDPYDYSNVSYFVGVGSSADKPQYESKPIKIVVERV